ncbi:hypothetical protein HPB52_019122 [Rhipicephalus sanguineus]|uniref:Uncharacterized protein n=1 Tax=Rhipicephalus sanguineus TaxID=34632 RepID=A0A9D4YQL7_RHISA|nr:hypothetical protein HPB52_019122 [Rhipicephalus sanguineus]
MSGEPSSARRRSARLATKRAEIAREDKDGATPSRPPVETNGFATPSGCQSTVKKPSATCKCTRVAQLAKRLKTVQEDELGVNMRTKGHDRTQQVNRHHEDVEEPKRSREETTLAETFPKRDAVATKSPTTAKLQRVRAEMASSEPSRQAKRIRRRWRSPSCSSEASKGGTSSGSSYHTAEDIASDTGSRTPEKENGALPTPAVRQTKFERLRRVWRWLVANDGAESGGGNEC